MTNVDDELRTKLVPGLKAETLHVFPVTFAQQRLWFLDQLQPNTASYSISWSIRTSGTLNVDALERSLNEIVRRHEVLRTTFSVVDEQPVQVVSDSMRVPLSVADISLNPDRESEVQRLALEEAQQALDLKSGPLVRARLVRLGEQDHILLLTTHHIIFDGWSRRILVGELSALYEAFCSGQPSPLAELPLQYSDYAVWQRKHLQGKNLEKQLAYWKQQLSGAPPSLDLPTDRPRPAVQTFRGAVQRFTIPRAGLDRLNTFSRQRGVTLFMTLLAGFQTLLSRYSGQEDIAVGTPIANRNFVKIEGLIGLFANTLVLRTQVSGDLSFQNLLVRVKEVALGAYAHQDMPFEKLVEELHPERSLSHNPLFQVLFSLQNAPRGAFKLAGLKLKQLDTTSGTAKFDISLFLVETPEGLFGRAEYNTDLFDEATIARMVANYQALLEAAVANPSLPLSELPLLSESQQRTILVEFNNTAADFRRDLCVHNFFERQVEHTPTATALVVEHERLTYQELNERANRLGHYLQERGVGPDVLVGICVERSVDMLVAVLGIMKSGGAYVPLDPAYPKRRLAMILEDAHISILLSQSSLKGILPEHSAQVIHLDTDWPEIAQQSGENPASAVKPENLGYVLFTSGSTGRPKGVAIEHRSAATFLQWAQTVFAPEEVSGTLFSTSICFDLSVFEMFVPLSMGGKVIMVQNAMFLPTSAAADQVTLINTVPSAIAELVAMDGVPASAQVVNLAGEPLPTSLAQQVYEKTAVRKLYNLYGPTEDTTYSTYTLVGKYEEVTIGRPLANTQVYILDNNRRLVPIGVPGELYLAGDGLARGYFGRSDLTAERFVPNPFSSQPGARMYRTGDLARFLPNGNIQYLGRVDEQVKLRGFRIELGEIEAVLAQCPGVRQAVALVREGQSGDKRLVAYVARAAGENVDTDQLRSRLKANLPEYMAPSKFMVLDQLPMTTNGKIDRRSLPAPELDHTEAGRIVAPRNELESILLPVFQETLGIEEIGVTDNFFDMGGHSLLALRLVAEVSKITGIRVPLSALFRGATVESLAEIVGGGAATHSDPVAMCIQPGDGGLAFFAVASPGVRTLGYALLARHMGEEQPAYRLQAAAPVAGKNPFTEEELANLSREYIAAMRSVQPEGPYCFIAMCEGVQIAQQMVLDLEADGQGVGFFAILDTWVLQNSQIKWRWRIDYYRQRLRTLRRMPFSQRLSRLKEALGTNLRAIATSERPEVSVQWHRAYWPGNDFKPPRFQAPVVLFKRPRQPFHYIDDPEMGWGGRSAGGVEIHPVDFRHVEILRMPYVGIIGNVLAGHMQRLRKRNQSLQSMEAASDPVSAAAKGMA